MKQIFILALFLIIILHLVINLFNNLAVDTYYKEGFNSKCSITNASSKSGKATRCQGATIENTRLTSLKREGKIKELENIVKKTRMQVVKNKKDILNNLFTAKQMQNVADSGNEDTSAACKQYDEAC